MRKETSLAMQNSLILSATILSYNRFTVTFGDKKRIRALEAVIISGTTNGVGLQGNTRIQVVNSDRGRWYYDSRQTMQLEDSDNGDDSFERNFYDLTDVDEDDVHNFITEATGASLLDRCVSIIHVEHTLWNCRRYGTR